MKRTTHSRRRNRAGAILSMELVLVLPIFLILLFAAVEFSMLIASDSKTAEAARHGVRMLCLTEASGAEVEAEVRRVLGPSMGPEADVSVYPAIAAGGTANVRITVPMSAATPDLLWWIGFSTTGRTITAESPMIREHLVVASTASSATTALTGRTF